MPLSPNKGYFVAIEPKKKKDGNFVVQYAISTLKLEVDLLGFKQI